MTSIQPSRKRKREKESATRPRFSKQKDYSKRLDDLEKNVAQLEINSTTELFSTLPLSDATQRGLKKRFYVNMTDIQAKSLPFSIKGQDVLGAARTGSGKTLAFLIPILEILYRKKWGPQDGLGALVISPTRELAMQIFEVLRSIGSFHTFSAGLVIGGKNLKDERDRLSRMNILVATPGRLLQHMDQTIGFDASNLQILVLDEADRILDMGFSKALNAIIAHLPTTRQSLLFSATQTQSVQDLARLSLNSPVVVGVQEEDHEAATPRSLEQHYALCSLPDKLSILMSFIKTHLQTKTLVFFSTCKQVRFAYETFCKLHPGVPLMHLHGKQKQSKRLEIFQKFTTTKNAFLFATDIAARGLDFPSVDWVVQLDCPEDTDTYIHRVGRTARYQSHGKSLLFLLPSEEGMVAALEEKSIPVQKIKIKESQTLNIQKQLQSFAFQDPDIKYLGQRYFISYLRSIYLQKNKAIFKIDALPLEEFAESLGLPGAPKVKFLTKEMAKQKKNASRQIEEALEESSSEEEEGTTPSTAVKTKYDRMFGRKNVKLEHYQKVIEENPGSDEEDLMTLKRVDHELPNQPTDQHRQDLSQRQLKLGKSKKGMLKYKGLGERLVFDEDGVAHAVYELQKTRVDENVEEVVKLGQEFAEEQRGFMREVDGEDKQVLREKKREKKRKKKDRERDVNSFTGAGIDSGEDDGYVSPVFDLPEDRPPKRRKVDTTLEDVEEMALAMLKK